MARRRRVIRFEQGPLAGQYRYVGAGGNCVEPPQGLSGISSPKGVTFSLQDKFETVVSNVSKVSGPVGARVPNCLGRQTNADRRAQYDAFNARNNPWTTHSDITGDIGEDFWIGLAVWGGDVVSDFVPGIIPIITPGDDWDDIEDVILPPPPPGTPPPPPQ